MAVYGVFMLPICWKLAGLVWGYALLWFLFNHWVKTKTYGHLLHSAYRGADTLSASAGGAIPTARLHDGTDISKQAELAAHVIDAEWKE